MKSYTWKILSKKNKDIIKTLLKNRGLNTPKSQKEFLSPHPPKYFPLPGLEKSLTRIKKAIKNKEKIIVYGDYDADGICSTAIIWETINSLGADVMPYIPKRLEEGYGLSKIGIDNLISDQKPNLIITVDQGITAHEPVNYCKQNGIDIIIIDHHIKPKKLPEAYSIIHTTDLCASGIAWFVANKLKKSNNISHLDLAAIGTIADMVPLIGLNRSLVKFGLEEINNSKRIGLNEIIEEAALKKGEIVTYEVGYIIAPRLNAMGRLEHALDSLRLLCAKNKAKAKALALHLGQTNRLRQQLTLDTSKHAKESVKEVKKLLFVSHETYEQGVIGLVAGKLVEEFYRPSIVISRGEIYSKASARSVAGFNIIEAIRNFESILVNAGGHPMAAGFTVETKKLSILQKNLEEFAQKKLADSLLERQLKIDAEIDLKDITWELYEKIKQFEPFGIGNPEPIFASKATILNFRTVGNANQHLKISFIIKSPILNLNSINAIAFNFGSLSSQLRPGQSADIAFSLSANHWNGTKSLELKIKDIKLLNPD